MKGESVLVEQEAGEEGGVRRNDEDARGFDFLFFRNGEQSHVAPEELNTTQSAPEK